MKALFKNFLFIVKRFKTASILNILGLSVAFAIAIIISIQIHYDITYNRNFEKSDNIVQLSFYYPEEDITGTVTSMPFAKELTDKIPDIKNHCILWSSNNEVLVKDDNGNMASQSINIEWATEDFAAVFTPTIIKGDISELHREKDKIVLTESTTKRLFGEADPIGQIVRKKQASQEYTVIAVCKDYPKNSLFGDIDGFGNLSFDSDKSEWSYHLYMEMPNESIDKLQKKLNAIDKSQGAFLIKYELRLDYLKDSYMNRGNNKTTFMSLLAIGIVILLIAYINYLNISVAMIPSRIKSIKIQKIYGIGNMKIAWMIICEGIGFAIIAFLFALFIVYLFGTTPLSEFFIADLSVGENLLQIIILGIVFISIIAIISIYPSHYASSIPETMTLNGSFALSPAGVSLRNILITIQFVSAISLCCIAFFIKVQHDYMKNYSIGLQKENIVYIPLKGIKTDIKTLGEEMCKNADISDYTASESVPGNIGLGWGRQFEGKQVRFVSWPVISNFLDFFEIKIIAGENFAESKNDSTELEQIILNQQFLDEYGFNQKEIMGKSLDGFSAGITRGVAGNINFQSVHYPIEPMGFVVLNGKYREKRLNYMFLKISGNNIPATVADIRKKWAEFSDEDFELTFLDQKMNTLYKKENNMAKLISLFGSMTILIAMMGLYGMIIFNTRYKVKEIAIRKVNGASESEIILMLNRNTLILLLAAFMISLPLSYYVITKWVENFAFKAPIYWWIFAGAGILVLIISIVTVSWQSRKAARNNPSDSLKTN